MIREYKKDDLEQILEIWINENISAHSFINKEYWIDNYKFVKQELPKSKVYVYELNNKIIGFIGLNNKYIEGIFVKGKMKSQGIGKELIKKAKQINKELKLNVYEKNIRAIRFYEKQGFIITKRFIDKETDEFQYTMEWKL